jgi:hypothetical protein
MHKKGKNRQLQPADDIADEAEEGSGDDAERQIFGFVGDDG